MCTLSRNSFWKNAQGRLLHTKVSTKRIVTTFPFSALRLLSTTKISSGNIPDYYSLFKDPPIDTKYTSAQKRYCSSNCDSSLSDPWHSLMGGCYSKIIFITVAPFHELLCFRLHFMEVLSKVLDKIYGSKERTWVWLKEE